MHKKIMLACMALVAFAAFAIVPAMASAAPTLKEGTTTLAVGAEIAGTQDGTEAWVFTTSSGNVSCNEVRFAGVVTENPGAKGTVKTASFKNNGSTSCPTTIFGVSSMVVTPKVPWCLSSTVLGTVKLVGGECGGKASGVKFVLDPNVGGECEYEKAEVTGTYTAGSEPLTADFTGNVFKLVRSTTLCPSEGTLDGKAILETPNGTSLKIE